MIRSPGWKSLRKAKLRTKTKHVVICGKVVDELSKFEDNEFDLIVADPPFNKDKDYGEFTDDNRKLEDYYSWVEDWIRLSFQKLKETGGFYIYINTQHLGRLQVICEKYGIWRNTIAWHYTNPTPSKKSYPKTWSAFLFFTKTDSYKFFEVERMRVHHTCVDRYDDKVIRLYDCWSDVSKLASGYLAQQECVFYPRTKNRIFTYQLPLELLRRIVLTSTDEGDEVLDLFSHSGTTSCACKECGRNSVAVEVNPEYCEWINKRLNKVNRWTLVKDIPHSRSKETF